MYNTTIHNVAGVPVYESYINIPNEIYTKVKNETTVLIDRIGESYYEHSSFDRNLLLEEDYKQLHDSALECCYDFLINHLKFDIPDDCVFLITNSWLMRMSSIPDTPTYVSVHHHPFALLTGVIYFDDDQSEIVCHNDIMRNFWFPFTWVATEVNDLNRYLIRIPTAPGKIVIFNSKMEHSVPYRKEVQGTRHSISFSIFPKGTISTYDTAKCII